MPFLLAQQGPPDRPHKIEAVKTGATLTLGLLVGVIIVAVVLVVIMNRQRRWIMRGSGRAKGRKKRAVTDAWAEAGKRIDPDAAGSRDDTVDIDPDELGPQDIDDGPAGGGGGRRR